ncbi:hypothetical protein ACQKL6_00950 [Peribacillus sp. NPDC097197]|uniref:hypothetical protein n=1 Tax=Peribacillus sp. NPDC097197 TaxID=3390615 RepID=UPI003CFD4279
MKQNESAINATQAVVTFEGEIGEATAENFTVDNNVTVIKAEVSADNKKEVKLTFNKALTDKDTYKVTVNGVKSATGSELKEAQTVEFKYEIAAVNSVALSTTKFYDGESILDSVVVKDKNGLVLDNDSLTLEISSTDAGAVAANGDVTTSTTKSFYVEVKVKEGSDTLATTGAVKVTVAPELEVTSFDGIHIGAATNVSTYENAKKLNKLNTTLKVNEDGAVLNLFGKDVDGNVVALSPVEASGSTAANYKITNLTPTVANVEVVNGEFVIKTITAGKAQAKIKVGDVETTVSFEVVANEKITDAKLSKDKVSLDTATGATKTSDTVSVSLLDQYGEDIDFPTTPAPVLNTEGTVVTFGDNSKLTVKSSNTKAATATVAADGTVTIDKVAKGSSTVTVEYKNAAGTVVFTKSIAVTVSEFDTETATYKLALASKNAVLDADDDTSETGADVDDAVKFVLNELDKNGNVINTKALDGSAAALTFTTSTAKDAAFLATAYAAGTGTIAFNSDAVVKLVNSGTVNVTATVGGVAVDTISVAYKNTDSVATKAVVNTSNRTVDLSNLGGTSVTSKELLFGKLNTAGTKYLLNPALTIQDQFAATMSYKIATATDLLANGLTVNSTPVVTNLNNVSNASGVLTLTDDSKAGTVTIVVPAVSTTANADLLAAPVSINVTLVK